MLGRIRLSSWRPRGRPQIHRTTPRHPWPTFPISSCTPCTLLGPTSSQQQHSDSNLDRRPSQCRRGEGVHSSQAHHKHFWWQLFFLHCKLTWIARGTSRNWRSYRRLLRNFRGAPLLRLCLFGCRSPWGPTWSHQRPNSSLPFDQLLWIF